MLKRRLSHHHLRLSFRLGPFPDRQFDVCFILLSYSRCTCSSYTSVNKQNTIRQSLLNVTNTPPKKRTKLPDATRGIQQDFNREHLLGPPHYDKSQCDLNQMIHLTNSASDAIINPSATFCAPGFFMVFSFL